jgi:hypothetical protein
MRDMNFFSSFIKKRARKQSKIAWFIFLLLTIGGIGVGIYFLADDAMGGLRAEVQKLKSESEIKPAENTVIKNKLISAYMQYGKYIDLVDQSMAAQSSLRADSLRALAACVPDAMVLDTLTVEAGTGNITGTAPSNLAVGQLCGNMTTSGFFDNVSIDNISKNEAGAFTFSVSFIPKGGEAQ